MRSRTSEAFPACAPGAPEEHPQAEDEPGEALGGRRRAPDLARAARVLIRSCRVRGTTCAEWRSGRSGEGATAPLLSRSSGRSSAGADVRTTSADERAARAAAARAAARLDGAGTARGSRRTACAAGLRAAVTRAATRGGAAAARLPTGAGYCQGVGLQEGPSFLASVDVEWRRRRSNFRRCSSHRCLHRSHLRPDRC